MSLPTAVSAGNGIKHTG